MRSLFFLFSLLFILVASTCGRAQSTYELPSLSPLGTLEQVVGNTTVTISYERPSVRGRKIFGGLVPWDKVWRTGAGYCTKIAFDRDVNLNHQAVPAGKYSLQTIPGKKEWMVIINTDTTLYGSADYDPAKDVVRFRVPANRSQRFYESLTIDLDIIPNNAQLYISWANVQINFLVETSTEKEIFAHVESLLQGPISKDIDYAWPAEHLLLSRQQLAKALALTDRQLQAEEQTWTWRLRMEIFEYQGYPQKALEAVHKGIAFRKANPLDPEQQAWSLDFWAKHEKRLEAAIKDE